MEVENKNYKRRLIDDIINKHLKVFGAISLVGPKWCGKTWTSLNHAKSVTYMTDRSAKDMAVIDPKYIFTNEWPQVIDEWQIVPGIWDSVRHECDKTSDRGKFILTGSTSLNKESDEGTHIYHSGTGRISILKMYPMSLYESGDSTGDISIMDMFEGKEIFKRTKKFELIDIARMIIKGGWPANQSFTEDDEMDIIPKSYIESVVTKDMNERDDKKRDSNRMRMLLRSLARNESSIAGNATLIKDIEEYENGDELIACRQTISDYLGVLSNLYMISNQEAYSINYRSSNRVGKSPKRHLIDPSLACACLDLDVSKLLGDHETFGLMFEALVERDLRIYIEYLGGHLFHFRDNVSGDEVDSILEFRNGEYAAIEIKLSSGSIDDAKRSLQSFYRNVTKKPKFMCIILGYYDAVMRDPETGIYIIPITALKP